MTILQIRQSSNELNLQECSCLHWCSAVLCWSMADRSARISCRGRMEDSPKERRLSSCSRQILNPRRHRCGDAPTGLKNHSNAITDAKRPPKKLHPWKNSTIGIVLWTSERKDLRYWTPSTRPLISAARSSSVTKREKIHDS